jgi:predicted dinucleotide-binding enzyme
VKALNIISSNYMVNPNLGGQKPTMFICGNEDLAKSQVNKILSMFGWDDVIDLGDITMSRYLEPMAMVYIVNSFKTNGWNTGLKLLRS